MNRFLLSISPAALALALSSATPLAAQSVAGHASRIGSCDPRIDVCALPPGGGALHFIDTSGSFLLGCNILVGPGQIGIAIGPNASSVVLDGNGFSIIGDPSLTSVGGLVFEPSPVQHASFTWVDVRVKYCVSDMDLIRNVGSVNVSGGDLWLCGASGMHFTDCGSVQVEGVSFSQCVTGIEASSVSSLTVSGCVLIDNGTAVSACGQSSRFTDVVIQGGSNGIVCDDSCLNPASMEPFSFQCSNTDIEHVLQTGLSVTQNGLPRGSYVVVRLGSVRSSGQDGISINVAGSLDLSVSNSSSSGNGGNGLKVTAGSVGASNTLITLADLRTNGNGGHGVEITSLGDVVMSATGGSSGHNGGDGVKVNSAGGPKLVKEIAYAFNAGNGATISSLGDVVLQCWGSDFSDNGGDGLNCKSGPQVTIKASKVNINSSIFHGNGSDGCDIDFSASSRSGHLKILDCSSMVNLNHGMRLNNADVSCESGDCSSNGLDGMNVQGGESTILNHWTFDENAGDGLHVLNSSVRFIECSSLHNGGDGIDCSSALTGSSASLFVSQSECSSNTGKGSASANYVGICYDTSRFVGNTGGGLKIDSVCIPVAGKFTSCAFISNGGVACDIQNAAGGEVSHCVVSGSSTGIHVGDSSGSGCCTGVRVSDNTVSSCTTGIAVDAGGHHLVLRNMASSCTSNFAVGTGNMFGPVVTGADPGTNPNANFAP